MKGGNGKGKGRVLCDALIKTIQNISDELYRFSGII
jgi:hypothetical protein